MKIRLTTFCLILCLHGIVLADANDGELLGFKIGDRITIGDESNIQYIWKSKGVPSSTHVFVNTESKPDDMDLVRLWITPISHTIIQIEGRLPSSSIGESKLIQKRYFEALKTEYPDWTSFFGCQGEFAIPTLTEIRGEPTGYEEHSCLLSNDKIIGSEYLFIISFREYDEQNSNNLHVWISLSPDIESPPDDPFRLSERAKFKALGEEEIQQFSDRYWKNNHKNADLKGLN